MTARIAESFSFRVAMAFPLRLKEQPEPAPPSRSDNLLLTFQHCSDDASFWSPVPMPTGQDDNCVRQCPQRCHAGGVDGPLEEARAPAGQALRSATNGRLGPRTARCAPLWFSA